MENLPNSFLRGIRLGGSKEEIDLFRRSNSNENRYLSTFPAKECSVLRPVFPYMRLDLIE